MKKLFITILFLPMILICLSSSALAENDMDWIVDAADPGSLIDVLRSEPALSDEIARYDALDREQQNNVRTGLYIRRKNPQTIDEFKSFFNEKIAEATTYMQFAEGYPQVQDNGIHGMTLTVKTDISGYIYIVAFPDAVEGGISDAQQFMAFYENDNGLYKKKVYLEGGREYTFPVSCGTYRRGGQYRAYLLLRVNNCYSQFQQVKYSVKELPYVLYRVGDTIFYAPDDADAEILVWSNHAFSHWSSDFSFYYDIDGNVVDFGFPFTDHTPYTQVRTYQFLGIAEIIPPEVRLVTRNTFYFTDGTQYTNSFILELRDGEFHIQTVD